MIREYIRKAGIAAAGCMLFFFCSAGAYAKDNSFDIDAESYMDDSNECVHVTVTVENDGDDFGGYVRITLGDYGLSAYERYIAIAEDAEESVTITIPYITGFDFSSSEVRVSILDERHNLLTETKLRRFFEDTGILYGGLTEKPGTLTHVEANRNSYSYGWGYGSSSESITYDTRDLTELTDISELSGLTYLIIDDFDISTLDPDGVEAIEEWVYSGGILLIGTGLAEDRTFAAFDDAFIDAEYRSIADGGSGVTDDYSSYYGNYSYALEWADIDYGSEYISNFTYDFNVKPTGMGYVVLFPFSFSSNGLDEYYFDSRLGDLMDELSRKGNRTIAMGDYTAEQYWELMQGPGTLKVGVLLFIVVVYVILVGPALYLVLKKKDQREKIWFFIPALSLGFVLILFLAGSGFSLKSKHFNTISVASADGNGIQTEYLFGMDSGQREWNIVLDKDTIGGGPLTDSWGYSSVDYTYLSSFSPDGVKLYYHPDSVFDGAYFKAIAPNSVEDGEIDFDLQLSSASRIKGEIENDTDYDFDYFLICINGKYAICEGVRHGGDIDVSVSDIYNSFEDIRYEANSIYYENDYQKAREYAALSIAAYSLQRYSNYVVGICRNKDGIIRSGAREEGYYCIYEVK